MNRATFLESFGHVAEAPGGIDKLRSLILTLAMRGMLTKREAGDEPATTMLGEARKAKADLIAAGQLRAPKVYPSIESGKEPYSIPPGWAWCRAVDLIHTVNGRAFKPSDWSSAGRPIIRIQNLNSAAAPYNYFSGPVDDRHVVEPGDLLISWSGTPGTSFGAFVWQGPAGVLNQHIFKCTLFGDYRDFICLAINSRLDVLIGDAHGGVGLQHFTKDKLERLPLAIPPVQEQQRVVAQVRNLLGLCSELERQQDSRVATRAALTASTLNRVETAESDEGLRAAAGVLAENIGLYLAPGDGDAAALGRVRQTILDLAVRGRLTEKDSSDEDARTLIERIADHQKLLGETKSIRRAFRPENVDSPAQHFQVPAGWAWCTLGQLIVSNEAGWSPVCVPESRSTPDQWGVLKLSAVSWGQFRPREHKLLAPGLEPRPAIEVHDGDFLMSRANTAALVGRSVVADGPPPRLMISDLIIRLRFVDRVTAEYVNLLNGSRLVRDLYATSSKGTSDTMRKLSRGQILETPVPLPPLAEQRRIVCRVTELTDLCDALGEQFTLAKTLRGDLAASLVTRAARAPAIA